RLGGQAQRPRRSLPGGSRARIRGPARARAAARRSLARRADRLLPARDSPQLSPRLPPRADAPRTRQLAARFRSRRAASALADARARNDTLALLAAASRTARVTRATPDRTPGGRLQQRTDAGSRAVHRRRAPP